MEFLVSKIGQNLLKVGGRLEKAKWDSDELWVSFGEGCMGHRSAFLSQTQAALSEVILDDWYNDQA